MHTRVALASLICGFVISGCGGAAGDGEKSKGADAGGKGGGAVEGIGSGSGAARGGAGMQDGPASGGASGGAGRSGDAGGIGGAGGGGGGIGGGGIGAGGTGGGGSGGSTVSDAGAMAERTDGVRPDGPAPGSDVAPPSGPGMWTKGPNLSAPRQELGATAIAGVLFVVGGQGPNGVLTEAFDPKTGKWELYDPMPVRVDHPNVATVGEKLYVLGGAGTSNVWEYNPLAPKADRKWVMKARLANPRNAAAVGVIANKIHLAGGSQGNSAVPIHDVYDPADNTWNATVAPLPEPREHVPGAVVNGIFYVISGRAAFAPGSMRTARVDAYDPATNMWTRKADIPTPRGGSGAAVLGNVIVVVGGEGNSAAGTRGIFPVTEEFDPVLNRWRSLAAPLTPRHGAYAAAIDGRLYWAGGALAQGGGADTPVFEIFSY